MEFNMTTTGFSGNFEFAALHVSGNEHEGFRPYQLLVSSIVGCSGSVLRKVLEKKRIHYSDMKITADVKRKANDAQEITSIHLHFVITGDSLSETKIKKSLEVSYRNCSIVQSVKDSICITESFEIVNH